MAGKNINDNTGSIIPSILKVEAELAEIEAGEKAQAALIIENARKEGNDILILAIGSSVGEALSAHSTLGEQKIFTTVVNCRFVKPLDSELIGKLARKIPRIITVEENVRLGGFGSAVLECLSDQGITGFSIECLAIPDTFIEHGSQKTLRAKYGIDAAAIVETANHLVRNTGNRLAEWPNSQAV